MSTFKKIEQDAHREIDLISSRLTRMRSNRRRVCADAIQRLDQAVELMNVATEITKQGYNNVGELLTHIHRNETMDVIKHGEEATIASRRAAGCRCGAPVTVKGSPRGDIGIVDRDDPLQEAGDHWSPIARLSPDSPVVGRGISPRDLQPLLPPPMAVPPTLGGKESARARRRRRIRAIVANK